MHTTFSVLVIHYYEMFCAGEIKMFHLPATISFWSQYTILHTENDSVDSGLSTKQCVLTTDNSTVSTTCNNILQLLNLYRDE